MPERQDEDLMVSAGRGDQDAFGALVERHHRAVVQFVYRYLGDVGRDDAEDVAQDVFLGAFKAAPSFRPRAKVLTWLLRIARNACLNYRRARRLRRTTPLDEAGSAATTIQPSDAAEAHAAAQEEVLRLRRAVADLPLRQRAAVILRHFHDLAYSDIADVLEVSVPSVESLLFRARRTLRSSLAAAGNQSESPQVSPELGAESLREDPVI